MVLQESFRLVTRWLRPTGLFVVVMGPDGVGKTTLIEQLIQAIEPAFCGHMRFHWRPMLLRRRQSSRDTTQPHSLPPHGPWYSACKLLAHILDYSLGYWAVVRPLLARSRLVIFDRYYDDVRIDPIRYRYGGPQLLASILRPLIPQPDVTLILDAPEGVILSRKSEVTLRDLTRLRRLYREHYISGKNAHILDAALPPSQVSADACKVLADTLTRRSMRRYRAWLPDARPTSLHTPSEKKL